MHRRQLIVTGLSLAAISGAAKAAESGNNFHLFNLNQLAPPTLEAMHLVDGFPVVEIGPGNGYWLRAMRGTGLEVIGGFDIAAPPNDPVVTLGNHKDAAHAAVAPDAGMLAVWPPDGNEIQRWIAARHWPKITLVGNPDRFDTGDTLRGYRKTAEINMPAGYKGPNALQVYHL